MRSQLFDLKDWSRGIYAAAGLAEKVWGKWPGMNPLKNCLLLWKHD